MLARGLNFFPEYAILNKAAALLFGQIASCFPDGAVA